MFRSLAFLTQLPAIAIRLVAAGNRNMVPYSFSGTGNANFMKYNRIRFQTPQFTGIQNPRVSYVNWYANPLGGESGTNFIAFKLWAALEYPLGTIYPMTFGGADFCQLDPGMRVECDPLPVTIAPGDAFYIRHDQEHLGVTGSYNALVNQLVAPGRNEAAQSGADNAVRKSTGGTITAVASLNQVYGPSLIRGIGSGANVLILGDSITRGSGDKTGTSGQGDYLSGTSPNAPYVNIGNVGWVERAIGGRHALFNLSVPSRVTNAYTDALAPGQFAMVDLAPPTHVVIASGINDVMQSGTTASQVITRVQTLIALCRSRWNNPVCYVTTLTPVANSSDGWATKANQMLAGTLPNGTNPNWANLTDNTGASGRSFYNAQVRANSLGADGFIDVAAQVSDPSDGRYWRTDIGIPTGDGIHPSQLMHTQATAALNRAIFDLTSNTSSLLTDSGDRLAAEDGSTLILES